MIPVRGFAFNCPCEIVGEPAGINCIDAARLSFDIKFARLKIVAHASCVRFLVVDDKAEHGSYVEA